MNELTFKSHTLTPIIINNLPYLGVHQIGVALQYARDDIVNKMYRSHADEFTPDMSFLTTVDTAGGKQQVRVFSLRGCHLLAMFSKTPVAKEFRRWVLDLIEQQNQSIANYGESAINMKAIGGAVKRCAAVAVREEINKVFNNILASAEQTNFFGEVKDDDLIRCLWNWYASHHKKTFNAIREITRENDELKCKLATIKKAVA